MKTDRLACSQPACKARLRPARPPRFTVELEVDAEGSVVSDVHDIEDHYFNCSYCGSEATTEGA